MMKRKASVGRAAPGAEQMVTSTSKSSARPSLSRRDREFLPAALEILETPPAAAPVALALVICGFVLAALIWAWFGHLDVVAVAPGKIDIQGFAKVIQSVDAGRVTMIPVSDGAHVKKDDVLLSLDDTTALADQIAASQNFLAATAESARRARAIALASQAGSEDRISLQEPSIDMSLDIPENLRRRSETILKADLALLRDTLISIDSQMAQKKAGQERIALNQAAQKVLVKTLDERVEMWRTLTRGKVGSKTGLFDAEEAQQRALASLADGAGELIEIEAALRELETERAKVVSSFIADNETKLEDAERRADTARQNAAKANDILARTRIRSPVDGVVQQLSLTTIGQVISPGQQLMMIDPQAGPLKVSALVSNQDIGFVEIGQEVTVKIDAFPFTRYGTLSGNIVRIATEGLNEQDAKRAQASAAATGSLAPALDTGGPGRPQSFVFPVEVVLDADRVMIGGKSFMLTPGMTVMVEIKTDRRRVIDYLLSPVRTVASEAFRER